VRLIIVSHIVPSIHAVIATKACIKMLKLYESVMIFVRDTKEKINAMREIFIRCLLRCDNASNGLYVDAPHIRKPIFHFCVFIV
jgi:N-acetylmuramic acid 6-phosphate (MurNAc-6-P) etherase